MGHKRHFCLVLVLMFFVIGCKEKQPATPESLRRAVRAGDLRQVQELITGGIDLSKDTWPDWTPLHDAAACGHRDIAELLIAKGAEIDPRDQSDRTPLILALSSGEESVAKLLVEKGANVNAIDTYGRTPILCAFHWIGESAVEFLIARGAHINAIIQPRNYTMAIFLLEHRPLHDAAKRGYKNLAELMISKGVDVNTKTEDGETPMDIASGAGHTDIVELLRSACGEFGVAKNVGREWIEK
ncbi:MAG: hypothetical protein A2Z25_04480 [Planctomycetes bacterium RBG_16_55_9]|nr:MAG: hypothetical protein A2Z25_04480 [Planctomycetes bacterium RBG_16_55_9]